MLTDLRDGQKLEVADLRAVDHTIFYGLFELDQGTLQLLKGTVVSL